jgi:hypothetical protein
MSYLKTVFGVTAFLVLAVAGINFLANPIGIYNPPLIKGFNDAYPAATAYARLEKTEAVKRLKPEVIITGSSRADIGLDPRAEFFPGMTAYNFALSAATLYEQRRTLEFAEMVHPLKKAIITLDFFTFNARKLENKQFEPERLSEDALSPWRSFFDSYGTIVALDTLIASIKNLQYIRHLDRYAYPEPNGHKIGNDVAYDVSVNGAARMFSHPPAEKETAVDDFSFAYSDKPGDDVFQHLDAMLDVARQNKTDVIVLLSPVHDWYIRGLEAKGKAALVAEWKKRIAEIVHAKGYPLWDFAYPNSLTTEPVPTADNKKSHMKWWWDPSHYKTELGDIVLRKVLGLPGSEKYPDFGQKL